MRVLFFILVWWIITDGNGSWVFAVPVILLATFASYHLQPGTALRLHPLALLRFIGFFLYHSVRAGIDVALRALSPGLRLAPGIIEYPLRLPAGAARVLLVDTISLLPGTLSVELRNDMLCLHVLDENLPVNEEVSRIESRIADVFYMALPGK